jgi:hypothetical protein
MAVKARIKFGYLKAKIKYKIFVAKHGTCNNGWIFPVEKCSF